MYNIIIVSEEYKWGVTHHYVILPVLNLTAISILLMSKY